MSMQNDTTPPVPSHVEGPAPSQPEPPRRRAGMWVGMGAVLTKPVPAGEVSTTDTIDLRGPGAPVQSPQTSPTNLGCGLWSTVAAAGLGDVTLHLATRHYLGYYAFTPSSLSRA